MKVFTFEKRYLTRGRSDMIDITADVEESIEKSKLEKGIVFAFVVGSTAAITTIEYEPGLKKDLPDVLEKIAPYNYDYEHHKTWHDYNGASHIRASLIGPSLAMPFVNSKPVLGTWQQVVLIDFDTHARERRVVFQVIGD